MIIKLKMSGMFFLSKDFEKAFIMYSPSDNTEAMIDIET